MSPPTALPPDDPHAIQPDHQRVSFNFTRREENRQAVSRLLTRAGHSIEIFSHCLDPHIFDQQEVLQAMKQLALGSRQAAIRILVRDPQSMISSGHRLLELMRRLSSSIEIRQTHSNYAECTNMYLIADGSGILYKESDQRYEGSLHHYHPGLAREWQHHFNEVWHHSAVPAGFRRLHI